MLDIECHMTFAPPDIVWLQSDVILVMQCMQTCSVIFCLLLPFFFARFFVCFFVFSFLVLISFNLLFEGAAVYRCTLSHSHTQPISETST